MEKKDWRTRFEEGSKTPEQLQNEAQAAKEQAEQRDADALEKYMHEALVEIDKTVKEIHENYLVSHGVDHISDYETVGVMHGQRSVLFSVKDGKRIRISVDGRSPGSKGEESFIRNYLQQFLALNSKQTERVDLRMYVGDLLGDWAEKHGFIRKV